MKYSFKKLILPIIIGVVTGAIIAGSHFFMRVYIDLRLPNKVEIAGEDYSLMLKDKAIEKLDERVAKYIKTGVLIKLGDEAVEISPEKLGVKVFPKETVEMIVEANAETTSLFEFFFSREEIRAGLILKIDEQKMKEVVSEAFNMEKLAPKSANFGMDKKKLEIIEGQAGFVLDFEKLKSEITNRVKGFKETEITLKKVQADPPLSVEDLEAQKEEMSERLTYVFTLVDPVFSDNWDERLIDNLNWVIFTPKESRVEIEINNEELNKFIEEKMSKWLDRPSEEVMISMDENKNVTIEGHGNNGTKIDRKMLKSALERAVSHKSSTINIPIIETEPSLRISDNLKELGISERIGLGHTSFYGSPANRVHNIKIGAAKFNGKLIAPGEIFSFNKNLGRVDETTGYKKELVIKPEGTIPEYGGGICQVSTTMYRAVLLSGLEVVERNQHSYAVSYYSQVLGHGLDATIYLGGADMKFRNDTENHILIQSYTKNDYELYFVFYGTKDGRAVEMEGPYISGHINPPKTIYEYTVDLKPGVKKTAEKAHAGFKAKWFRHIIYGNGEKKVEPILTDYRAMPAKILVGVAPKE